MDSYVPSIEVLRKFNYLALSDEKPSITRFCKFEYIFILANIFADLNDTILIKMARIWQNISNDKAFNNLNEEAIKFELDLRTFFKEDDFNKVTEFLHRLNYESIKRIVEVFESKYSNPTISLDSYIVRWLKQEITNLEYIALETYEDRDNAELEAVKTNSSLAADDSHNIFHIHNMDQICSKLLMKDEDKYQSIQICESISEDLIDEIEKCIEVNKRNLDWSNKLLNDLVSKTKIIICVGDFHMIGKNGLLQRFSELEYITEIFDYDGILHNFDHLHDKIIWKDSVEQKLDSTILSGQDNLIFQQSEIKAIGDL